MWFNLIFVTLIALWIYHLTFDAKRLTSGLLFLNSYNYHYFFPAELNGPLWSIGLEVSCYVFLPFVLFALIKATRKPTLLLVGLISVIAFLQAINPWIISTFMTDSDLKGWQFGLAGGAKQWLPYWNVASFFSQFLLGSLAALTVAIFRVKGKKPHFIADALGVIALVAATIVV